MEEEGNNKRPSVLSGESATATDYSSPYHLLLPLPSSPSVSPPPISLLYHPPVIDLSSSDVDSLRASLVSALSSSINPVFLITSHPCIELFRRFSSRTLSRVKDDATRSAILSQPQYAIDLYEETDCGPEEISRLKDEMKKLSHDIMNKLLGNKTFEQVLEERNLKYGVPDPKLCDLSPSAISQAGIPSFGGNASPGVSESHWKYIAAAPRVEGSQTASTELGGECIVVSVGEQWFGSEGNGAWKDVGVQCPLLHRVALPESFGEMRMSMPFLGRLFSRDEKLEGEWQD